MPRAEQVAILDDDDDDDGDDDDDDDDDFGGCGGGGDHYGDDDDLLTFEFQTPGFAIVIDRRSGTWQEIQVCFPQNAFFSHISTSTSASHNSAPAPADFWCMLTTASACLMTFHSVFCAICQQKQ